MSNWQTKLSTARLERWQRNLVTRILLSPHFKDKEEAMKLLLVLLVIYSVPDDEPGCRKEVCLAGELPKPKRRETQTTGGKSEEERKRVATMIRRLREDLQKYFESEGRHEAWHIQIEEHSKLVRFVRDFVNSLWAPHLPQPESGWKDHELGIVYPEPLFLRPMASDYFIRHRQINDKTSSQRKSKLAEQHPFLRGLHDCRHYIGAGDARCMLSLTKWFERKNVRTSHFGAFTHQAWKHLTGDSLLLIGNNRTNWTVRHLQDKMQMDVRFAIRDRGIEIPTAPKPSLLKDETRPGESKSRTGYGTIIRRRHPDTKRVLTFILVNEGPLNLLLAEYMTDEKKLRDLFTDHVCIDEKKELPTEFEIVFSGKLDTSDHSIDDTATPLAYRLGAGPAFLRKSSDKPEYEMIPQEQSQPSKAVRNARPKQRSIPTRQKR